MSKNSTFKYADTIEEFLSKAEGKPEDICRAALDIINTKKECAEFAFRNFLEHMDTRISSGEVKVESLIDAKMLEEYEPKARDFLNSVLNSFIDRSSEPEDFYRDLWQIICSPFFADDNQRAIGLYCLCTDARIPYVVISCGKRMKPEKYNKLVKKIKNSIKVGIRILNLECEHCIEQTPLLWEELKKLNNDDEAAVFLAYMLHTHTLLVQNRDLDED